MRIFVGLCLLTLPLYAQTPSYELRLSDALQKAKIKSEILKSSEKESFAAQERAESTQSALYPTLSLDGNLRYVSEVPSVQIIPKGPAFPFGAHLNYSIGPTLTYTVWDGGATRNAHKSASKSVEASKQNERSSRVQVLASVKLAYVNTQLNLEQLKLLSDSVSLAESERRDIENRRKEGAASELDYLTAQKEVLNYQLHYKQKQSELAASLRDLVAFVEDKINFEIHDPAPKGFANAKLWIQLDSIEESMKKESHDEAFTLHALPPQIQSQKLLAESLDLQAQSKNAALYPQLQISGRSSLDYPDGPILKRINQNTFAVGFYWPLYEFSKTKHLVAEKTFEAEAVRHRAKQMESDVQRDFAKVKETLRSLRQQDLDSQKLVLESEKLSKLNYETYRLGRINFVDVQAANLKALEAKVNLAQIHAQMLVQWILLETLAVKDDL